MNKAKRIMREENAVISREGRFLLSIIIALLLAVLAGITFIVIAQETQGKMLDQHIQSAVVVDVPEKEVAAEAKTEEVAKEEPVEKESVELLGTFETTFYCAGFGPGCPTCGTNGITATGDKCSPLGNKWVTIAVDPRVIPYGTELKIVMGDTIIYGVAEDTGGFAGGLYPVKQIDICTANHEEAITLGVKQAEVYVVKGE